MNKYTQIRYWIEDLPKKGKRTFSLEEAAKQFPEKPFAQVKNAVGRLVSAGKVQSVWRGYYTIIMPEYGLKGIVPPTEYIDHLMRYLGKPYYVALLSAADLHGASHQKPQTFTFISDQILHPKVKKSIRLEPVLKRHIPENYLVKMNVQSGSINVSTPELTALDLLLYQKKSGGINNIATVLTELAESMDFEKVDVDFFNRIPSAAIQRLGFLLDAISGQKILADCLLEKAKAANIFFRKTSLVTQLKNAKAEEYPFDTKWKVLINYKVEPGV